MRFEKVFDEFPQVGEVHEIVGEWELWFKADAVKIRVTLSNAGIYSFDSSHHYKGTGQIGAYQSSKLTFATAEEALRHALLEKTLFYDPDDKGAQWIKNEEY